MTSQLATLSGEDFFDFPDLPSEPFQKQCAREGCQNWFSTRRTPEKRYCSKDCQEQTLRDRRRERKIAERMGVSIEDDSPDADLEQPSLVVRAVKSDWEIPEDVKSRLPQVMSTLAVSDAVKPKDRVAAARAIIAMKDQSLKLAQMEQDAQKETPVGQAPPINFQQILASVTVVLQEQGVIPTRLEPRSLKPMDKE